MYESISKQIEDVLTTIVSALDIIKRLDNKIKLLDQRLKALGGQMSTYILLLFFHIGNADSNTSTLITGFNSESSCTIAGEKAKVLVNGAVRRVEYVCLYQPK